MMCYAIPALIQSIDKDKALVDYGGVIKTINVSLIDSPKKGDYVLVHAGFAIEKLKEQSAKASLGLISEYLDTVK